jgi:hypothetical protein
VWVKNLTTGAFTIQSSAATSNTNYGDLATSTPYPATASATVFTAVPTAGNIFVGTDARTNASANSYVAYVWGQAAIFGENQNQQILSVDTASTSTTPNFHTTITHNFQHCFRFSSSASDLVQIYSAYNRGIATPNQAETFYGSIAYVSATSNGNLTNSYQNGNLGTAGASYTQLGVISTSEQVANRVYMWFRNRTQKQPTGTNQITSYSFVSGAIGTQVNYGLNFDYAMIKADGASGIVGLTTRNNNFAGFSAGPVIYSFGGATISGYATVNASVPTTSVIGGSNFLQSVSASAGSYNQVFKFAYKAHMPTNWAGTAAARTLTHELGDTPTCIYVLGPLNSTVFYIYFSTANTTYSTGGGAQAAAFSVTSVTSTQFSVGASLSSSALAYSAYLFANCPNVCFQGTYTGNGSSQNIDCGFSTTAKSMIIMGIGNAVTWYFIIQSTQASFIALNAPTGTAANDTLVRQFSSGFSLTGAGTQNVNARVYHYIAFT